QVPAIQFVAHPPRNKLNCRNLPTLDWHAEPKLLTDRSVTNNATGSISCEPRRYPIEAPTEAPLEASQGRPAGRDRRSRARGVRRTRVRRDEARRRGPASRCDQGHRLPLLRQ